MKRNHRESFRKFVPRQWTGKEVSVAISWELLTGTHKDGIDAMINMFSIIQLFINMWPNTYPSRVRRFFPVNLESQLQFTLHHLNMQILQFRLLWCQLL
jgi:hypothetical protein